MVNSLNTFQQYHILESPDPLSQPNPSPLPVFTNLFKKIDFHYRNPSIVPNINSNSWPSFRYIIYTDASKKKTGEVGAAFYDTVADFGNKYSVPKEYTIFSAEAYALLMSLEYIEVQQYANVIICTDSLSLCEAIKKKKENSSSIIHLILHTNERLFKKGVRIKIIWIPAHAGITGNEKADQLAKDASNESCSSNIEITSSDLIRMNKEKMWEEWQNTWYEGVILESTQLTKIVIKVKKVPWFKSVTVNNKRGFVSTMIRLRSGHGIFPKHLQRIGVRNDDLCDYCDSVGTLQHIICECKNFDVERSQLINALTELNIVFPANIIDILALQNLKIYILIWKFLNDCRLKI